MKKIIIMLVSVILLTGCGDVTAKGKVKMFLEEYQSLSANVTEALEERISNEEWSLEQKDKYRRIMKRQYRDLEYTIMDERYNSGIAYIDVKIEVYNLYTVQEDNYYDNSTDLSYLDYKLDAMLNTNDRIEYLITFKLEKEGNGYQIIDLQDSDIEKIHGIYH